MKTFRIKKLDNKEMLGEYLVEWKPTEDTWNGIRVSLHAAHCLRKLLKDSGYHYRDKL